MDLSNLKPAPGSVKREKRIGRGEGSGRQHGPDYPNGSLWFHSAPQGRKMELIRKNSRATFEITQNEEVMKGKMACDWTSRYRSVMGSGNVEIIEDKEAKRAGLDVIMRKYGAAGELVYRDSSLEKMVILKLQIDYLSAKQSES